jgi:urea ABC transporter permease protein UrtC
LKGILDRVDGGTVDRPEAGGRFGVSRIAVVAMLLLAIAPVGMTNFYVFLITRAFIFAIFAISVDLIWGYGGIWVFGHAAFFGFGGYIMGKLLIEYPVPAVSYVGLVLSVILPAVAGLIMAYPLFSQSIENFYFAIITLAVAMIAQQTALSLRNVTGGYDGMSGIPALELGIPEVVMLPVTGVVGYYVALVSMILAYYFARRTVNSPFGRVMVAISENQTKAESLGYDVPKHRTMAFGLSCGMAGLAGALYAGHVGFLSPELLGFLLSAEVIFWVLLGGRGTLVGAVVGTLFITILESLLSGSFQFTWRLMLGVLFVLIVLFFPAGIWGLVDVVRDRVPTPMAS